MLHQHNSNCSFFKLLYQKKNNIGLIIYQFDVKRYQDTQKDKKEIVFGVTITYVMFIKKTMTYVTAPM